MSCTRFGIYTQGQGHSNEYSQTSEVHLNFTVNREYLAQDLGSTPWPQPGVKGYLKGLFGAFVTYCNISC